MWYLRDFRSGPTLAFILVRNSDNGTVRLHRHKIEDAIVICICDGDRIYELEMLEGRAVAELTLPLVHEYVKFPRSVFDDRCIRISVSIEVGPGEATNPEIPVKG